MTKQQLFNISNLRQVNFKQRFQKKRIKNWASEINKNLI